MFCKASSVMLATKPTQAAEAHVAAVRGLLSSSESSPHADISAIFEAALRQLDCWDDTLLKDAATSFCTKGDAHAREWFDVRTRLARVEGEAHGRTSFSSIIRQQIRFAEDRAPAQMIG